MSEENLTKNDVFTEQEKTSVSRYCSVLKNVHNRLMVEGYFLKGGKTWNIFKVGTPICEISEEI